MPTAIPLRDLLASNEQIREILAPDTGPSAVLLFDYFFSDNLGRPAQDFNTFIQWTVSGGSVDFVGGTGLGVFGAPPEQPNGRYVDLGGSTGDPGLFQSRLAYPLIAGQTYNLTFDYRSTGGDLNTAIAFVGDTQFAVSTSGTDFRTFSLDFVAPATGLFTVNFQGSETDRDNSGVGIDGILFGNVLDAENSLQIGGDFADTIRGRSGNDVIFGESGNDTIDARGGNDRIEGGAGADRIDGGVGNDTAVYENSSAGVTINLQTGVASGGEAQGDTLLNVENVIGTASADAITGSALANYLVGNGGDDFFEGLAGGDILVGGAGTDAASYASSNATVAINLTNQTGAGGDAAGDQLLGIENVTGSAFGDLLRGDGQANVLTGGAGGDFLLGEAGNDTLIGGAGGDFLTGGAGNDIFVFRPGPSTDAEIIIDFDAAGMGNDVLRFEGFGAGFDFSDISLFTVNNTGVAVYANGNTLVAVLRDAVGLVGADDFVFV